MAQLKINSLEFHPQKLWKSGGGSCFFRQGAQNHLMHFTLQGMKYTVSIFMFIPCLNDD